MPMTDSDELLLLGLLSGAAMHGYRLNDVIRSRLGQIEGAPRPSTAYARLAKLAERGLVRSRAQRQGRFPERRIYELTEAGRDRFLALLRSCLRDPQASVDVAVMFLRALPRDEWARLLDERQSALVTQRDAFARLRDAHGRSSPAHWLAKRRLALLDAESDWFDQLRSEAAIDRL